MGIFNKRLGVKPFELTFANVLITVIMSMVVVQSLGLIFSGSWGSTINLGPSFILIAVGMSAALSIVIFKKMIEGREVTQKDIFAIVIVMGLTLILLFFLRDFVPEIFVQGVLELQSSLGFS